MAQISKRYVEAPHEKLAKETFYKCDIELELQFLLLTVHSLHKRLRFLADWSLVPSNLEVLKAICQS